jgi:hypothetical protein
MQRTDAAKWFWPFMLVAAIAGATVVALPASAPVEVTPQPQFRMVVTVTARPSGLAQTLRPVALDPYRIEVKAKRPSILERLAGLVAHES